MENIEQQAPQQHSIESIKQLLFDTFIAHYKSAIDVINRTPMRADLKQFAILFMDTGMMWAQQGIASANFPPTPSAATEPKESVLNAVVDALVEEKKADE